jgi:hypothetical protein
MISYKRLTSTVDIELYLEGYYNSFEGKLAVNNIPLTVEDCLMFDHIWGLFARIDGVEQLVGGYILNEYPYRSLQNKEFSFESHNLVSGNCGEITALWKNKQCPNYNVFGWPHIMKEVYSLPCEVIFGTAFPAHNMYNVYMCATPTVVFKGNSKEEVSVFYYTKRQFAMTVFKGLSNRLLNVPRGVARSFPLKTQVSSSRSRQ